MVVFLYVIEVKIDLFVFVQSIVMSGIRVEFKGIWFLLDNLMVFVGFVVDLLVDLQGMLDWFLLFDVIGVKVGDCVVIGMQFVCDFDSVYLCSYFFGLFGRFLFWVMVMIQVIEQIIVDYDFGDVIVLVDVKFDLFICIEDCMFMGCLNFKSGEYQNSMDMIQWDVVIGVGVMGMIGGQEVVVKDVIGVNQEFFF